MKRLVAIALAMILVLGSIPSAAFAAEGDAPQIIATADKSSVKPGEAVHIL